MKGSKKGKKTFSVELGEQFHHVLHEDNLRDNPSMFTFDRPTEELIEKLIIAEEEANALPTKSSKKKSKSFTETLEDFFNESIESESKTSQPLATVKRNIQRNSTRLAVGIDVLLNRTLVEEEELPQNIKRLTLVLDDQKLEQLKKIARKSNKKINDVVLELIELYISKLPPPAKATKPESEAKKIKTP
jgi:hypothetical protein